MRRVVVKIGSSCLTKKNGMLDADQIDHLASQISVMRETADIILVTSGAVAAGMGELGMTTRPRRLGDLQGLAAIGQSILMNYYHDVFGKHAIVTAQILLTHWNFTVREQFLNFRSALDALLRMKTLPIINENDPVAVKELSGDNDYLAAVVACNIDADSLLMLSDIEGVYDRDPSRPGATLLTHITKITSQIDQLTGKAKGFHSSGGITTKIRAARLCQKSGVEMRIINGRKKGLMLRAFKGEEVGTLVHSLEKTKKRHIWMEIARPAGFIVIDKGAVKALRQGKSLLASGVKEVRKVFSSGDIAGIEDEKGMLIAKGKSCYSSDQLLRIKGRKSGEIAIILGKKSSSTVVSSENVVLV